MVSWLLNSVSISLFAQLILLITAPGQMSAQQRGVVKDDSLRVYSQMSANGDVVTTLVHGTVVRITLSVSSEEGSWCSISKADTSEKLGYVRCDGLERQHDPNAAQTALGTEGGTPPFTGQAFSHAQKHWAIATSAILATFNHESLDTLSSGGNILGTKLILQNAWSVSNRDDLLNTLEWIDQGGHRQLFSALGARASKASPEQLKEVLSHLDLEDANSVRVASRYYSKYGEQSIAAWDYARYINLCRWGVDVGYISEQEAWPRVMHAAEILQHTFNSWSEFGENYLVGREFWSLRQTKIDGQQMRTIYRGLLDNAASPWNRISWSLPLQAGGSASPNSPSLSSSSQSTTAENSCESLMHLAASDQIADIESILLAQPNLANCRDKRGWTPLHYAAFGGQTKMIQILVTHGAGLDATDNDRNTPLHVAASSGNVSTVDVLIQNHAATELRASNGYTPLNSAVFRDHADVVRLLLEHGADVESRDNEGYTPVNTAVWFERTDMVALLLTAGSNPNTKAKNGATPLQGAASKGDVGSATLLLEHGAGVEARDTHGFTALHSAANEGQALVAKLLLAHGADINARTDAGDTPLHWAAYKGKMNAAKLLLENGAKVNPSDTDGNTPLHWAAARGHVQMTELLLANGADIKAKTRFGCTPLRGAYDFHQEATAQVLLRHGAAE